MTEVENKYEKTFTPAAFAVEGVDYAGTVTMRMPAWDERADFLESFGLANGEAIKEAVKDPSGVHKLTRHLSKQVIGFVVRVDITRKSDGAKISSWEDIRHETDLAQALVPELSWWLLGKHRLGNPSAPS